jgi:hypothetical protein
MAVLIPTVHLNGSHAEGLRDEAHRAMRAIGDAISALGDMGPNARDYYPQGPDVASMAQRDHEDRIRRLRSVLTEIAAIHDGVDDQIVERDARRRSR